jgi:hypothetical protein
MAIVAGRWFGDMACTHQGFHTTSSSYDHGARILTYFRRCEECGARLTDISRLDYEPRFDPHGNDPFLPGADSPAAGATN